MIKKPANKNESLNPAVKARVQSIAVCIKKRIQLCEKSCFAAMIAHHRPSPCILDNQPHPHFPILCTDNYLCQQRWPRTTAICLPVLINHSCNLNPGSPLRRHLPQRRIKEALRWVSSLSYYDTSVCNMNRVLRVGALGWIPITCTGISTNGNIVGKISEGKRHAFNSCIPRTSPSMKSHEILLKPIKIM